MMLKADFDATGQDLYVVYRSTMDQGWKKIYLSTLWVLEPGGDYVRCLSTLGKSQLIADLRLSRKLVDWFFRSYPGEQLRMVI